MNKGYNPKDVYLLPQELSEGLPEALRNLDVPAFERARYRRESTVGGLVGAVQEQLAGGNEIYIRGSNGVLVPENRLRELREKGVIIRGLRYSSLVKMPSPEDAAQIFKNAYQTVDNNMPSEYQEEARQRLAEIEPKFAGTLEEAVAAFGAVLPTPPQE